MPYFGRTSKRRLVGVHPDLRAILDDVVKIYDITIPPDGGARTRERQAELYRNGDSQRLDSHHIIQADGYAHAVDPVPYPVDWDDRRRFDIMAGLLFMAAEKRGIKIRWGGDWDMDWDLRDQEFHDLPHIELVT